MDPSINNFYDINSPDICLTRFDPSRQILEHYFKHCASEYQVSSTSHCNNNNEHKDRTRVSNLVREWAEDRSEKVYQMFDGVLLAQIDDKRLN
jgi:hypothetical protein